MIIAPFRRMMPSAAPTITPGSVSFTTPGTYNFEVPYFHTLTSDCRGAGGGGAACTVYARIPGNAGGYSYFNAPTGNVVGYGGQGGEGRNLAESSEIGGHAGAHGTGLNGDTNITAGGSPGGYQGVYTQNGAYGGGPGGYGGRAVKTWVRGLLVPRSIIQVLVGAGGVQSFGDQYSTPAGPGVNGAVYISWS